MRRRGGAARQVVRSIDVAVRDVRWSDSGELVALIGEASFYVLRFRREAVDDWLASGGEPDDDGVQDAFELLNEVSERVRTGARPAARRAASAAGASGPQPCAWRNRVCAWCRPAASRRAAGRQRGVSCVQACGRAMASSAERPGRTRRPVGGRLLHLQQRGLAAQLLRGRRGHDHVPPGPAHVPARLPGLPVARVPHRQGAPPCSDSRAPRKPPRAARAARHERPNICLYPAPSAPLTLARSVVASGRGAAAGAARASPRAPQALQGGPVHGRPAAAGMHACARDRSRAP